MEGLVNMDIRNTIYECSRSTEGITKWTVNLKWTLGKSEDEKVAAQKKLCAKVASTEPGALDALSTCFATSPSARPTRSHKLLGPSHRTRLSLQFCFSFTSSVMSLDGYDGDATELMETYGMSHPMSCGRPLSGPRQTSS